MAFVMGVMTILRMTRTIPRKITHAAVDYAMVYGAESVKSQASFCRQPATVVAPMEYGNVFKRLAELEEKVSALSKKPAEMAPEKEQILNAAVRRIDDLETELESTKKVMILTSRSTEGILFGLRRDFVDLGRPFLQALQESLARQEELRVVVEKKKKKSKMVCHVE